MKKVENFLPISYCNGIESLMLSEAIPWHFLSEAVPSHKLKVDNYKSSPLLYHNFIRDNKDMSKFSLYLRPFIHMMESLLQESLYPRRMKANLNFNSIHSHDGDTPHIDTANPSSDYVAIFYPTDSDGDTIIYNETGEEIPNTFTIKERVTPVKNRLIIFDGDQWHSSNRPIKYPQRVTINIVLDLVRNRNSNRHDDFNP